MLMMKISLFFLVFFDEDKIERKTYNLNENDNIPKIIITKDNEITSFKSLFDFGHFIESITFT